MCFCFHPPCLVVSAVFESKAKAHSPFFLVMKGPAADATDAPQPWRFLCNPVMKIIIFYPFPSNGAPVEWNWQGKTEVLGEKPVTVPLCPPQIPHGLTRDRTWASAVGGRRQTAWAMARPHFSLNCMSAFNSVTDYSPWRWPRRVETCRRFLRIKIVCNLVH
jgi:hypothetical protein